MWQRYNFTLKSRACSRFLRCNNGPQRGFCRPVLASHPLPTRFTIQPATAASSPIAIHAKPTGTRLKLHSETRTGINFITACDGAFVQVNETRHGTPLIVLAQQLIDTWQPASFDTLAPEHFTALAELGVEIILLGTGAKQRFPDPRLARRLMEKRIGLEVMDTAAACRTYNILVSEGRSVAAALLPA